MTNDQQTEPRTLLVEPDPVRRRAWETALRGRGHSVMGTGLADAAQFAGWRGEAAAPAGVLLKHNGLHLEIQVDRTHNIGKDDPAGLIASAFHIDPNFFYHRLPPISPMRHRSPKVYLANQSFSRSASRRWI